MQTTGYMHSGNQGRLADLVGSQQHGLQPAGNVPVAVPVAVPAMVQIGHRLVQANMQLRALVCRLDEVGMRAIGSTGLPPQQNGISAETQPVPPSGLLVTRELEQLEGWLNNLAAVIEQVERIA